ncbi:3-isopropylmalate dehydrogenase [Cyphellophora europaea CBS 101466]|uniref:3-isopropylmalate dehydrogenase n=1 Tax=Cyphellophora europaea (strain CBS 101466) TaxID=1220924 RepID=W2RIB0_CYPE1|nr:3-isopropylmalate dehydrogenase [Cyphellophora europaea CBS 101466]ETN36252.1 3-isopropylmalate dehydrogenase [Cyphellophora europaea CBS 101466]
MIASNSKREFSILMLDGDGIGPEVMAEATLLLNQLSARPDSRASFKLLPRLFGGCSIDAHGTSVTDEVLEVGRTCDAILMGAVGGPKWDGMRRGFEGPEGATLRLREVTQVYANMRPAEYFKDGGSPIREELVKGAKFIVLRENCGGAFYGPKVEEPDYASDLWSYKREEVERIARMAAHLARSPASPVKKVISCDKANVLASSRLWRRIVEETIKREFPDVEIVHQLADSAAMLIPAKPTMFNGVVLADNTFGDLLSDLAGVIPGTLGVLPSACLADIPVTEFGSKTVKGFYEPVHGSAPDIAGQGIANPIGTILSAALMLRYSFGMEEDAQAIEQAVNAALDSGVKTRDMKGNTSTREMGDQIRSHLTRILDAKK